MTKYIIRLDDACATFNLQKWQRYFTLFDKYGIKPIIAVIPENKSLEFNENPKNPNFWKLVKDWENKGWCIAMHGLDHVYVTKNSGILGTMPAVSEFAGLPYEKQLEKLKRARTIFNENGFDPKVFVAPSHTLDHNTLRALKSATNIEIISDSFALTPYIKYDFKWIPMQSWSFRARPKGIWTICLHPEIGSDNEVLKLDSFLKENIESMTTVENLTFAKMGISDYLLRYLLYTKRRWMKFKNGHY